MAHFAELAEDMSVIRVVVIADSDCLDENGVENEDVGKDFCSTLFGGTWVQTSFNGRIRFQYAQPGFYYCPEQDVFSRTPAPGPWAFLNDRGEWAAEFPINVHTGEPLSHDELRWICYYIRNTKSYRFCPAVPKDPSDDFLSIACTSNDFMYPTFEGLMYGSNRSQQISQAVIENGKITIPFIHSLRKEADLTPLGIVLEVKWESLNPDVAADSLNSHPQTASRTRHELFRLIIEWALAHTEFGNNEPAAVTCHNILRAVQMPLNVRNDLLEQVPPQAVECYLRNEYPFHGTAFETLEDPPCPASFGEWYEELEGQYPPLFGNATVTIDVSSFPDSYPM